VIGDRFSVDLLVQFLYLLIQVHHLPLSYLWGYLFIVFFLLGCDFEHSKFLSQLVVFISGFSQKFLVVSDNSVGVSYKGVDCALKALYSFTEFLDIIYIEVDRTYTVRGVFD
jgi:hypothetical protein